VSRRDDDLGDLLDRIGRRNAGLTVDDVAAVVADVLKSHKRELIRHMQRMLTLERVKNSAPQNQTRFDNLHARLTAAESAIRILQKDRFR
jgi:hypothetical protein